MSPSTPDRSEIRKLAKEILKFVSLRIRKRRESFERGTNGQVALSREALNEQKIGVTASGGEMDTMNT